MSVKELVENTIAGNSIAIFSKSYCPYCRKAKQLLSSEFPDVQAKVLELDEMEEGADIQNYLLQKTGQRTVPNVFINQQHIGGSDSVAALQKQGKLKSLI
ncbi:glutaredoxin [Cristinia sonorae]|uniref:glutathione peroxidase n=1 Tax=Cristinia sonorae TaxID=1940300 RepID=A0A8K0UJ40_9AGAR|nr:glutaredoxin [Cristinia sonorae]